MFYGLHWTLIVMAAGVAWAALAYWRPGSVALAASWCVGQFWYYKTGDQLPFALYLVLDAMVIVALFTQVRVALDWFVLSIFPMQWFAYTWDDPFVIWWFLWALALAQMVLAGPWPSQQSVKGSVTHGPRRSYAGEP